MDEFDAVDIVYDAVITADTNIPVYKDSSESVTVEHIVINHLDLNELEFVNKIVVNVNIFVPLKSNGMYARQRMKMVKWKDVIMNGWNFLPLMILRKWYE